METPSARPLVAASAFSSAVTAVYSTAGLTPSPLVAFGIPGLVFLSAAWWIQKDAAARRVQLVHDWGLLAWVAWPILVPLYAWKTRGWNGWRLTLGLFGAILAPYLVAVLVYLAFHFLPSLAPRHPGQASQG